MVTHNNAVTGRGIALSKEQKQLIEAGFVARFGDSPEYARRRRIVIAVLQRQTHNKRRAMLARLDRLADRMIQVGKGDR